MSIIQFEFWQYMLLCQPHYNQDREHFPYRRRFLAPPHSVPNYWSAFCHYKLLFSRFSYKQNHTTLLCCVWLFLLSIFSRFFFFNFWVVSHMDILQFVYPLTWMDSWVVPSFLLFLNKITVNVCVQVFVWTHVFIACGNIPKSVIAGLCGKCMFNF